MKLDQERQQKVNSITSDVKELIEDAISVPDTLSCVSDIICQLDTDIAIAVMEKINTKESNYQATAIKVNYGY
jgi:hypothetical protein